MNIKTISQGGKDSYAILNITTGLFSEPHMHTSDETAVEYYGEVEVPHKWAQTVDQSKGLILLRKMQAAIDAGVSWAAANTKEWESWYDGIADEYRIEFVANLKTMQEAKLVLVKIQTTTTTIVDHV